MKQPVQITPITVPSVSITKNKEGGIIDVYVGNLLTTHGPGTFQGRQALLFMSPSQAECLVHDLAAKLGMTVS